MAIMSQIRDGLLITDSWDIYWVIIIKVYSLDASGILGTLSKEERPDLCGLLMYEEF